MKFVSNETDVLSIMVRAAELVARELGETGNSNLADDQKMFLTCRDQLLPATLAACHADIPQNINVRAQLVRMARNGRRVLAERGHPLPQFA